MTQTLKEIDSSLLLALLFLFPDNKGVELAFIQSIEPDLKTLCNITGIKRIMFPLLPDLEIHPMENVAGSPFMRSSFFELTIEGGKIISLPDAKTRRQFIMQEYSSLMRFFHIRGMHDKIDLLNSIKKIHNE